MQLLFCLLVLNGHYLLLFSLSDEMPKLVKGDSGRVVQIFANLISNSLKFTTCKHALLLINLNFYLVFLVVFRNYNLHEYIVSRWKEE